MRIESRADGSANDVSGPDADSPDVQTTVDASLTDRAGRTPPNAEGRS
jgi:hypothetical protein